MSGYTRWSPGLCQPLVTVNGRPRRGQSRTLRAGWPCASARSFGLFFIDGISGTHAASTRTFLAYTNGCYCLELLVSVVQWPFPHPSLGLFDHICRRSEISPTLFAIPFATIYLLCALYLCRSQAAAP